MPQTVIASEAKQSLRLLRHCVPRNDTFLLKLNWRYHETGFQQREGVEFSDLPD
jgi:hypothetical protein